MNTKIIKLDINNKMYETITAKQGDTESRFLLFHLFDASLPFDLTEKSVRVYGIKPDGTKIFNDLVINDVKKGYCTLKLTNQMLAIAGLVKLELVIYSGNKKLSSIPFMLNVISSLNSDDAVVSTNEFTSLMNGLAALSEYDIYKSNAKQVPGIKEEVSNLSSQLVTKAQQVDLEVEKKRIDSFTKLKEGSTTGDSELIDARIGADGKTYSNVGNGIRNQFKNINTVCPLFVNKSNLFDKDSSEIVNLMKSSNSDIIVPVGGVQSIIFKCNPSSTYNVSFSGGNRYIVYHTSEYPSLDVVVNKTTYIRESSEILNGNVRYEGDVVTGENDNYLVVYFANNVQYADTKNWIQITEGSGLKPFAKFFSEYELSGLKVDVRKDEYTFKQDIKQDLGKLDKGYLVICVDDGTEYDVSVTFPIIRESNIPMSFCLFDTSPILTNPIYKTEFDSLLSTYKCDVVQHATSVMDSWDIETVENYFIQQQKSMQEKGYSCSSFVASENKSSENIRLVGSKYFDLICSEPNKDNYRRTNRYALGRFAITTGFGLQMYKSRIDKAIKDKQLLILYYHSVTMQNEAFLQLLKDIIVYAKSSGIEITTLKSFFLNS